MLNRHKKSAVDDAFYCTLCFTKPNCQSKAFFNQKLLFYRDFISGKVIEIYHTGRALSREKSKKSFADPYLIFGAGLDGKCRVFHLFSAYFHRAFFYFSSYFIFTCPGGLT